MSLNLLYVVISASPRLKANFIDPASSLADRVKIGDEKHLTTSGAHEHIDPDP